MLCRSDGVKGVSAGHGFTIVVKAMAYRSAFVSVLMMGVAAASEIPQGAHVLLRMENSISTRTAQEGDYVYLRTATAIAADGHIAIAPGSYVQGVVTLAKRSGRVKGRAELAIRLESITLVDGKTFKFAPHVSAVDSGESGQKVVGHENTIEQAPDRGKDAEQIGDPGRQRRRPGWFSGPELERRRHRRRSWIGGRSRDSADDPR